MNTKIYIISDTHFSHENIIKYCKRPFDDIDEMDEYMVEKWNSIVGDNDKVYHLGDVYFNKSRENKEEYFSKLLGMLRGRKELILGNHDKGKDELLLNYFDKVHSILALPKKGVILSHAPLHPSCFIDKKANIHGHIHNNYSIVDRRYINASVELHDYSPILLDDLLDI